MTSPYPAERVEQYVAALRGADTYAQLTDHRDLVRFAEAVIAVAIAETGPAYCAGYATGRSHAGADGWVLAEFAPVFTTSDGTDRPISELRHRSCGGLLQGVGPHSLIDLAALAARHECPTTGKDGRQ